MAGDGGEIRPFERKFDTARRVGRQLIKQIPPARIGLIGATARNCALCGTAAFT